MDCCVHRGAEGMIDIRGHNFVELFFLFHIDISSNDQIEISTIHILINFIFIVLNILYCLTLNYIHVSMYLWVGTCTGMQVFLSQRHQIPLVLQLQ